MLGAAAVQDTAVLVRAAVRKPLEAVNAVEEQAAQELRCSETSGSGAARTCAKPPCGHYPILPNTST